MNDKVFEERLGRELDALQEELAPARDLWPGIDHTINSNTIAVPKPVAIAASIMRVVSLAFYGSLSVSRDSASDNVGINAGINVGINALIAFLQSEHERNKQTLLVEYWGQPALAPDWEGQMQQLEQAKQAIYEALREDP
jgi:hypothetical protein